MKRNKRGHLYYMCSFGDDGCGANFQSRTDVCDSHLLSKMGTKKAAPKAVDVPKDLPVETKTQEKPKPSSDIFGFFG